MTLSTNFVCNSDLSTLNEVSRTWVRLMIATSGYSIYALSAEYHAAVAQSITGALAKYQQEVEAMKDASILIVRYARKSKTGEESKDRDRLLQRMVSRLRERSCADLVYVSPRSRSNELLVERDDTDQATCSVIERHRWQHASANDKDSDELRSIVVDLIPSTNDIVIFKRSDILADPTSLKAFSCSQLSWFA
ncbi:hypothetical protein VTP01DRAFT_7709 [Rhizomucor pusillus]|uniref:uncharacterized protein n=1 Tax=Rhizomucor pusillus TaxID=4840 RepID=UPI003743AB9B